MIKRALLWCIIVSSLVVTPWTSAKAQDVADQWASLSIAEFVPEADRLLAQEQTDEERAALKQALAEHAAGRLRGLAPEDTLDRQTFVNLYNLGGSELNEQEQATISLRAVPPQSETAAWTFEEYHEEFAKLAGQRVVPKATRQVVADQWFADHSLPAYADRIHAEMFPIFHDKSDREAWYSAQEVLTSTAKHCRAKLAEPGVASTMNAMDRLKYLRMAFLWASREQKEELATDFCPTAGEAAGWTFDELCEAHERMKKLRLGRQRLSTVTGGWLMANGDVDLSVEQAAALYDDAAVPEARTYKLTATWTGSVTAPTTGIYEFSICPIDVNTDIPGEKMWHTVAAWVDGQQVIDSTPENWSPEGGSVNLQSGQSVPIRFELTF